MDDSSSSSATGSDFIPNPNGHVDVNGPMKSGMKAKNSKLKSRKVSVSFASSVSVANILSDSTFNLSDLRPKDVDVDVSLQGERRLTFKEKKLRAAESVPLKATTPDTTPDAPLIVPVEAPLSSDGSIWSPEPARPVDFETPAAEMRKTYNQRKAEREAQANLEVSIQLPLRKSLRRTKQADFQIPNVPKVKASAKKKKEKKSSEAEIPMDTNEREGSKSNSEDVRKNKKTALSSNEKLPAVEIPVDPNESIKGVQRRVRREVVPAPTDRVKLRRELEEMRAKRAEEVAKEQENIAPLEEPIEPPETLRDVGQSHNSDRVSLAIPPIDNTEPGLLLPLIFPVSDDLRTLPEQFEETPVATETLIQKPSKIPRAVGKRKRVTAESSTPEAVATSEVVGISAQKKKRLPFSGKRRRSGGRNSAPTASTEEDEESLEDVSPVKSVELPEPTVEERMAELMDSISSEPSTFDPSQPSATPSQPILQHQDSLSPSYPEAPVIPIPVERPAQTAFALLARLTPAKEIQKTSASAATIPVSAADVPDAALSTDTDIADDEEGTLPLDADTGSHNETVESSAASENGHVDGSAVPSQEEMEVDEENKSDVTGSDEEEYEDVEEEEDEEENDAVEDETEFTTTPATSDKSLYLSAERLKNNPHSKSVHDTPGPSRLSADAALGLHDDTGNDMFNKLRSPKAAPKKRAAKKKVQKKKSEVLPRRWVKQLAEFFYQKRLSTNVVDAMHQGILRIYRNFCEDLESFCIEKKSDTITDWTQVYEFLRRQNLVENYNEYCGLVHRHLPNYAIKELVPKVVDGRCVPKYDPKIIEEIDITLNETRARRTVIENDDDSD